MSKGIFCIDKWLVRRKKTQIGVSCQSLKWRQVINAGEQKLTVKYIHHWPGKQEITEKRMSADNTVLFKIVSLKANCEELKEDCKTEGQKSDKWIIQHNIDAEKQS